MPSRAKLRPHAASRAGLETEVVGRILVGGKFRPGSDLNSYEAETAVRDERLCYQTIRCHPIQLPKLDPQRPGPCAAVAASSVPHFATAGFEFLHVPDLCLPQLHSFASQPPEKSDPRWRDLHKHLQIFVAAHLKPIFGESLAVAVDEVYRATAIKQPGPNGYHTIPMAHQDFPDDIGDVLEAFKNNWQPRLQAALPSLTDRTYDALRTSVVACVTLWLPLNDEVLTKPLAVLDSSTLKPTDRIAYRTQRADGTQFFPKLLMEGSIASQRARRWHVGLGLRRGQAILFDAQNTFHAALDRQEDPSMERRSLEVRFLLLDSSRLPPVGSHSTV